MFSRWVTSNKACEPAEQFIALANCGDESDLVGWSLLVLAAAVVSFPHLPLELPDRNKMVLQPRCECHSRCNLHRNNARLTRFVAKKKGYCGIPARTRTTNLWLTIPGCYIRMKLVLAEGTKRDELMMEGTSRQFEFLVGFHTSRLSGCWHSPDYNCVSYQDSPLGTCQHEPQNKAWGLGRTPQPRIHLTLESCLIANSPSGNTLKASVAKS